jgi:16S rRNA (uracil1498-N3)-methyltransferase
LILNLFMLRRFIADVVAGNRAAVTGAHALHLSRVLRARVGQEFDIVAGARVRRGRIIQAADERVDFELGEEIPAGANGRVVLYLSVFKFDRMEWAIEKCTELGVTRIVPLAATRSDVHLVTAAGKRVDRWRRLARQAAEQSRRVSPPEIDDPIKLRRGELRVEGRRIVLAESEQQLSLRDAIASVGITTAAGESDSPVTLAIGPEGGWTERELEWFSAAGWLRASLGKTILRAETAAIAALAVVMSELQR